MSAIYGIFHKDRRPVDRQHLERMGVAMQAWGSDGNCIWINGPLGLGHRLLHTTPESMYERQPFVQAEEPQLAITADARLDNRKDLSQLLGINFTQANVMPDSQLILLAYQKWGPTPDCTEKLLGAYAFVIWDSKRQELYCGRDHMGFRPFFYYDSKEVFVFASDIRALLHHPMVPQRLDLEMLAACLQIQTHYAEKSRSYYQGICKLPPAHELSMLQESSSLRQYWSLENVPEVRFTNEAHYAEQLRELVEQAVDCRLKSAFPVGAHLSGGLDSTTLAVMAGRALGQRGLPFTAYSWSPPPAPGEMESDERREIAALCGLEGIDCHFIQYSEADIMRILRRDFTCEPVEMMEREQIVQDQAAANGVRVMLSGWGGDEGVTFNGRGYLLELFRRGRWGALHRLLQQRAREVDGGWVRRGRCYAGLVYRGAFTPLLPDIVVGWRDPMAVNLPAPASCINPSFAHRYRREVRALRGQSLRAGKDMHHLQRQLLAFGHLTRRMEAWAISGAARHIEYRYPLLDRRLLEFVLGVPSDLTIQNGVHRALFRQAIEGILPPELQWKLSKREPAAIGQVLEIFPKALDSYYQQVRQDRSPEKLIEYLDLERLDELAPKMTDHLYGAGVIIKAASLFSVRALN